MSDFSFSFGPKLTERQETQRQLTEEAAQVLRQAGVRCRVVHLVASEKLPKADSAMIVIEVLE